MDRSYKRQRANTDGESIASQPSNFAGYQPPPSNTMPEYDLGECIEALGAVDDARYVHSSYSEHIHVERSKVIDFDHCSKTVWYSINKKYASMSGSKQYDVAFSVYDEIRDIIASISERAGVEHASFGTKCSALETMRKIGKTSCLSSGDTLAHEVQKQASHDTSFVDGMFEVVDAMSDAECEKMCAVHDGRSTFLDKMEELAEVGGDSEEEDSEEEDSEEEDSEEEDSEEDEQEVEEGMHGFVNVADEMLFLECFDPGGAPRRDKRSQAISKRLG